MVSKISITVQEHKVDHSPNERDERPPFPSREEQRDKATKYIDKYVGIQAEKVNNDDLDNLCQTKRKCLTDLHRRNVL